MMEFIALNMAPIMFISLIIFLLLGYPVAFALAANGLLFFVFAVELTPYSGGAFSLDWPLLSALPARFFATMSNETMLAIPFFTFMGVVLERSGMAEDLLDTIGQLFGPIRGGLAYAVVIVGALLAATTGVVAASVIAMGLISLPIMMRYGYDRSLASGVIAASGTLAQIVPPSLVLIVLADQLGRSVGDMYKGAMIPGLALAGMYMVYILIVSIVSPKKLPALPPEARTLGHGITSLFVAFAAIIGLGYGLITWFSGIMSQTNAEVLGAAAAVIIVYLFALCDKNLGWNVMSRLAQQVVIVLIPPLALVFLVLGTIFLGIATPTEGGAMGAAGAMLLALMKKRLTWATMQQAVVSTVRLSAFVMFIMLGARVFSLTFYGVNGHIWVEHLLTSLPGGATGFIIFVAVLVFFLAFFLDYFELAFIIIPLLVAPAQALGIDLIWFGVILALNMQTSFMHPPFGFALHFLRSVAPRVPYIDKITGQKIAPITSGQIYLGAIPFMALQLGMMIIVIAFPQLVMHYKGPEIDTSNVVIQMPAGGGAAAVGGLGAPSLGGPSLGAPSLGAPSMGGPSLGTPSLGAPSVAPAAPSLGAPNLTAPTVTP